MSLGETRKETYRKEGREEKEAGRVYEKAVGEAASEADEDVGS